MQSIAASDHGQVSVLDRLLARLRESERRDQEDSTLPPTQLSHAVVHRDLLSLRTCDSSPSAHQKPRARPMQPGYLDSWPIPSVGARNLWSDAVRRLRPGAMGASPQDYTGVRGSTETGKRHTREEGAARDNGQHHTHMRSHAVTCGQMATALRHRAAPAPWPTAQSACAR
jgi:hypothetical protein